MTNYENLKKGFILTLIILVIIVAVSGIYFFGIQKSNSRPTTFIKTTVNSPDLSVASSSATNPGAEWKTYTNNYYSIRIDYPTRFQVIENAKREPFYDTLGSFVAQPKDSFNIRVIHDIDIYKNSKPEAVAKREIMDSGLKYNITTTKVGDYFAAITTYDVIYPTVISIVVTIAHPSKNLFVVLEINTDLSRVDFEQLLSSFKFLDITNTSSWKTYVAADNIFSFKFPFQWAAQPNQILGSRSVTEFRFQNNPLFTVTLLGNYNQITGQPFKTLEEYLGVRNAKSKVFSLNGIPAKRVTDPGEAGHVLPYEEVVVFSKDNKFIVSLYFEPDYYPSAVQDKTFDQILSTLKFK